MAQRAEIDLNSGEGGLAFRQWGMSIPFDYKNNRIRHKQFHMDLPKENAPDMPVKLPNEFLATKSVNSFEEADHPSSSFHLPALDLTHIVVLD